MKLFTAALVGISFCFIMVGALMWMLPDFISDELWLAIVGPILIAVGLLGLVFTLQIRLPDGQPAFSFTRFFWGTTSFSYSLVGLYAIGLGMSTLNEGNDPNAILGWLLLVCGIVILVVSRRLQPKG